MNKVRLEITSDRPIQINLNSLKVQGALMMAAMAGYLDKGSVKYNAETSTVDVTLKEKSIQFIEERLK